MSTRAVRNNNPGNLYTGGKIIFPGQIGTDANGFAIFNSYDAGVEAASSNLLSYAKGGFDTPSEIAHRWSTTDQDAYTQNIASALGVGPNQQVNLNDPAVRTAALGAIFHQEDSNFNAQNNLSDIWSKITDAAKNGTPLTFPWGVMGEVASNMHGVLAQAGNAVAGDGTPIGDALHFDLGAWLQEQATGAAKQYLLPVAVGLGAILLVMLSAWGLVKDTGVGQSASSAVKTAGKAMVFL